MNSFRQQSAAAAKQTYDNLKPLNLSMSIPTPHSQSSYLSGLSNSNNSEAEAFNLVNIVNQSLLDEPPQSLQPSVTVAAPAPEAEQQMAALRIDLKSRPFKTETKKLLKKYADNILKVPTTGPPIRSI